MRLLLYSRVGKNRDTRRETPAGAGAACAAGHKAFLFSQKVLAAQKPMTYTDLLANVTVLFNVNKLFYFLNAQFLWLNRYHTWARVVTY